MTAPSDIGDDCDSTAQKEHEHTGKADKAGRDEDLQIAAVGVEDITLFI